MRHEDARTALADIARELAGADRLLVGCDFDGTIAPIVGDPAAARPLPGAMAALGALAALPQTQVALISGRARGDLQQLVGSPPGVILIGSHGTEWGSDFAEALSTDQSRLHRLVLRQLTEIVTGVPGALLEKKPAAVAVHVRQASRPDAARVLSAIEQGPAQLAGVSVLFGKEVVELSVVAGTKGQAVARLRAMFAPTATAYLGDDTTDEAAFAELGYGDAGFKIGIGDSQAGFLLAGPLQAVELLAMILQWRRPVVGSADQ